MHLETTLYQQIYIKYLWLWAYLDILVKNLNLKLIWKFIQINIRDTDSYSDSDCYFKSLPIATYYLSWIHIKYLYLYSKTYNMSLKLNLYLTSLSHHGPVNASTPTFGNINLIERIKKLIVSWKSSQKRWQGSLFVP